MRAIREYLKHKPCLRGQILDRGELKRVARACGLSPQEARGELRRLGYVLSKNSHGLPIWTLPKADRSECKAVRPKAKRTCDGGCCPH
jgi:hypothetical protein